MLGFSVCFLCTPRRKIWTPTVPGKCLNFSAILISGAIINIISDFAVLALPIGSVWQLQMATKHKIGISAVFAVGLLYVLRQHLSRGAGMVTPYPYLVLTALSACISSIMRLVASVVAIRSQDNTWDLVKTYLWTYAAIPPPVSVSLHSTKNHQSDGANLFPLTASPKSPAV